MKKYLLFVLALAVALSFGAPAMAKDGLSVGFGLGLKPNLNNLGDTIADDGLDGGLEQSFWGKVILDEKTLLSLEKATVVKGNTLPGPLVKDAEVSGAMSGLDFAINARYDFMNFFFGRIGFNYTMKVMGGETSWKYTAAAEATLTAGLIAAGVPAGTAAALAAPVDGYKASQKWTSSAWAIPMTVGINLPIMDGKANIYAGVGLSYASATWSVEIQTLDILFGVAASGVGAKTTEKVEFSYAGIAPMYLLGFDAEIVNNVSIFFEWETTLGMGYSDVKKVTSTVGVAALGTNNLAYPVVTGGQILRLGAKYSFGALL